eukprot:TRINITY_DN21370_c0_g1_i1.p1 TRINITY_DN21370_c0_g1~~TRINITY_DN21370_c0_g1_i1.p1  ORF type:complete len:124 (-),score=18.05 TRINITY_DN21370_c0_g1_i1:27-398(-)
MCIRDRAKDIKRIFTPLGFQEAYFNKGIALTSSYNPSDSFKNPVNLLNATVEAEIIHSTLEEFWKVKQFHMFCQRYGQKNFLTRVRICLDTNYTMIDCNSDLIQDKRRECTGNITISAFSEGI